MNSDNIPKTKKPIIGDTPNILLSNVQDVRFKTSDAFNDLIIEKGYDVYLDRALRCPCAVRSTGTGLPNCLNCGGCGWFFVDRKSTKAQVLGMNNKKRYENWSEVNLGIANITVRAEDRLALMDRLILIDLEAWYSEILYPIVVDDEVFSFTIYDPIEVLDAYLFLGSERKLTKLFLGEDFSIDNNVIKFLKYKDLAINNTLCVSIKYSHLPVYHVVDINRDLVKTKQNDCISIDNLKSLPIACMGKKAHYIFDAKNLNSNQVFENTKI